MGAANNAPHHAQRRLSYPLVFGYVEAYGQLGRRRMQNTHPKKPMRLAVCSAGLGLGNATRVHAILEELFAQNAVASVTLFTWGNASRYFRDQANLYGRAVKIRELRAYSRESENVYDARYWLRLPILALRYIGNSWSIAGALWKNRVDLAVLDSDFHFLPFLLFRVPRVAISQAPFVVKEMLRLRPRSWRLWWRFALFECTDFLLHWSFSSKVLVPALHENVVFRGKLRSVGLIVRENFLQSPECPHNGVALIQSGSGYRSAEMSALAREHRWSTWNGRDGYNLDADTRPRFSRFSVIATQCGLSSLSECLAARKKILAFPIPLHPEQYVNARVIEARRFGSVAHTDLSAKELDDKINAVAKLQPVAWPACDGARRASEEIWSSYVQS